MVEAGFASVDDVKENDWPGIDPGDPDWDDFRDVCDNNNTTWQAIMNGEHGEKAANLFKRGMQRCRRNNSSGC